MALTITLAAIQQAWDCHDPILVEYIIQLAGEPDYPDDVQIKDNALTFKKFLSTILNPTFRKKPAEEQQAYRVEQIKAMESEQADPPLSDKLKLHQIILLLWRDESAFARMCLLQVIRDIPLTYGPWRALKHIFKAAEAAHDYPLLGALAARFDSAMANNQYQVSRLTLQYLNRRAWRFLRQIGQQLPACYSEVVCCYLAKYPDDTQWRNTWVANHVFFHQTKRYGVERFHLTSSQLREPLKFRAFPEHWTRLARPLLQLLLTARASRVLDFASALLQQSFKAQLRDIDADWINRLIQRQHKSVDEFVLWLLQNSPRYEQIQFRELGIHQSILLWLNSACPAARQYACEYVLAYARDLPLVQVLQYAMSQHSDVHKVAQTLLQNYDPKQAVGLEGWGRLLSSRHGHSLAKQMLIQHFGRKELTPEWFSERLCDNERRVFRFATEHLAQLYTLAQLGSTFFVELIQQGCRRDCDHRYQLIDFCMNNLRQFDAATVSTATWQQLLLNPYTSDTMRDWVDYNNFALNYFDVSFCKAVAFHVDFERHPAIQLLRADHEQDWCRELAFNEDLSDWMLEALSDVRSISPTALGLDWLMCLVQREEARYHDFAIELMSRAFSPADFAMQAEAAPQQAVAEQTSVDFQQASFLFTGKLSTMTRAEAEQKVVSNNGSKASGVTKTLDYLVIGDEGSPLYGNGRKGSKQVKAEKLNQAGAQIQIISETAFLQRIAGTVVQHSDDQVTQGCEVLWQMATQADASDSAQARFALRYLTLHQTELCLKQTDRPVDPGYEIPDSFLNADRVLPLLTHPHKPLRQFALALAELKLAGWAITPAQLAQLCDAPFSDVRGFMQRALLADGKTESAGYRIETSALTADMVFGLCESHLAETRDLGIALLMRHTHLQKADDIFRLTESPDRMIRAKAIRLLWQRYSASRKAVALHADQWPAQADALEALLTRLLYEIPPARPSKAVGARLKPLPAHLAKLALIETLRDFALSDVAFAERIVPLLRVFMHSRGLRERSACLVAITRIEHCYPDGLALQ